MSGLPAVQVEYARLEDELQTWARRDPSVPHRRYELAARDAQALARTIAAAFAACADQVELELAEYRELKTWGE